ncbi:hypothetical protein [Nocardia sp. NPDC127526]
MTSLDAIRAAENIAQCACPCHDGLEHCDHCCQQQLCDDCLTYAMEG